MDWIKQQEPSICCLQEMYLASKDSKSTSKVGKILPGKWKLYISRHSCPYMGQSKLQAKASQRDKQIRCCYTNKGNFSLRGHNTCKYLASLGYILTPTPIWDGTGGSGAKCREWRWCSYIWGSRTQSETAVTAASTLQSVK